MPEASIEVAIAALKLQMEELTQRQLHTIAIVKTLVKEVRELNAEVAQLEGPKSRSRKQARPQQPTPKQR